MLSDTSQPTSSRSFCLSCNLYKTDRVLEHHHCRPQGIRKIFVLPYPCNCSINTWAILRDHWVRGFTLPVLSSFLVPQTLSCVVVVPLLLFTSKEGLSLHMPSVSICPWCTLGTSWKGDSTFLCSRSHPYSYPRVTGFPFPTVACKGDVMHDYQYYLWSFYCQGINVFRQLGI